MLWWTLQNLVVTGLLAGAVCLACGVGRIGPVGRHAMWLIVMVKLLTPPLVFWPWTIGAPLRLDHGGAKKVAIVADDARLTQINASAMTSDAIINARSNEDGFEGQDSDEWSSSAPAISAPAVYPQVAVIPPVMPYQRNWKAWLLPMAMAIWIAGMFSFAGVQVARIAQMLLRLRRSAPAGEQLSGRVVELSGRVGVCPVEVRLVYGIGSPLIWSLVHPTLVWPAELATDLSEGAITGLIVHELAHVKRKDHWVGWLELLAGCVWWWNPLYWYARHQLRENAELACDGWVVQMLPHGRRAYGEALLAVCEFMSRQSTPMPAVGIGTGSRRFLERRLIMILQERFPLRLSRLGLAAIGLLALASIPAWSQKAPEEQTPKQSDAYRPMRLENYPSVRPELPADAREALQQLEQQQAEIRQEAEDKIAKSRELAIQHLQAMQDQHARAGELDEAVAIRDRIRQLQGALHAYRPGAFFPPPFDAGGAGLPDPGNLVAYRDRVGQSFLFKVTGRAEGSVWGTGVYTDDSTLAAAAVHAGLLKPDERGVVRVTILPGLESYEGITRNGVTSSSYPKWTGSYIVQRPDTSPRQSGSAIDLSNPQTLREHVGEVIKVEVVGSTSGTVWGTDTYTDDSPVGAAAVHAGLLHDGERGVICIIPLPGRESYEPSTRNGITSQPWPAWGGSYRLTHAEPATINLGGGFTSEPVRKDAVTRF